jgi:hypothetical protein
MTISSDDGAPRKQVMPAMTQRLDNKVAASRNVNNETPVNKPAPPPDTGLTSMKPVGAGKHRGY